MAGNKGVWSQLFTWAFFLIGKPERSVTTLYILEIVGS
jgi:hypothetical protein